MLLGVAEPQTLSRVEDAQWKCKGGRKDNGGLFFRSCTRLVGQGQNEERNGGPTSLVQVAGQ